MIKVFTTNKDGKIELTKDELKKLLDEAYWEGYKSNSSLYVYNTPSWLSSPYTITCNGEPSTAADYVIPTSSTSNASKE